MPTRDNKDSLHHRFVQELNDVINRSEVTQTALARDLEYSNPNIISMFKSGKTRLPLDRVEPLANILTVDAAGLLRLWFECYRPEALPVIERHFGTALTKNEQTWLTKIRQHYGDVVPSVDASMFRASK